MIRMMSFAVLRDRDPEDQMEEERFRRVREICKMFTDEGLLPVHENCGNYGGMGYTYSLKLIENVPGLKLVFDTGNPIGTDDRSKPKPYPEQSPWEFYNKVKEHVVYIHIKDAKWNADRTKRNACFPGEGDGDVKEIVTDMLKNGYDGGISIEPHMALSADLPADFKFNNYVEYGRRMMQLVADIKTGL